MGQTKVDKALRDLEGMRIIAENEMLIQGMYSEEQISDENLIGSICGGRKHCAIGSLWTAHGIKGQKRPGHFGAFAPEGVFQTERQDFIKSRPALRLALNALNAAAAEYVDHLDLASFEENGYKGIISWFEDEVEFPDMIERLFESDLMTGREKDILIEVIDRAEQLIRTGEVT